MKSERVVFMHRCRRCSWKWPSSSSNPARCPRCNSAKWKTV